MLITQIFHRKYFLNGTAFLLVSFVIIYYFLVGSTELVVLVFDVFRFKIVSKIVVHCSIVKSMTSLRTEFVST